MGYTTSTPVLPKNFDLRDYVNTEVVERATYPHFATSSGRLFRSFRLYPENVKGRPLFPRSGWSRLCSPHPNS